MSRIIRGLILILALMPSFLDVISPSESCKRSCRNYEKNPITVQIYDYNGEVYNQYLIQTNIYKNTVLDFSEYDNPKLDGHIFLGWYLVQPHYQEKIHITTLEELEEQTGQIVEKLPTRVSNDCMYFPLLINNDNLINFIETSKLAAVEVELRLVFPDKVDNTIAKANLHNTYQEVISFYLEQEGYTYFGCSDVNYGNDVFIEKVNKGELELFDITKKLEYGTYFTLNIYFTK